MEAGTLTQSPLGYLPLMAIAFVLSYLWLYIFVKRRRLLKRSSVKGLFRQHVHLQFSTQKLPLSLPTTETLELGFGERYSVNHQSIDELMNPAKWNGDRF